jgi:hypothetical protein
VAHVSGRAAEQRGTYENCEQDEEPDAARPNLISLPNVRLGSSWCRIDRELASRETIRVFGSLAGGRHPYLPRSPRFRCKPPQSYYSPPLTCDTLKADLLALRASPKVELLTITYSADLGRETAGLDKGFVTKCLGAAGHLRSKILPGVGAS